MSSPHVVEQAVIGENRAFAYREPLIQPLGQENDAALVEM